MEGKSLEIPHALSRNTESMYQCKGACWIYGSLH